MTVYRFCHAEKNASPARLALLSFNESLSLDKNHGKRQVVSTCIHNGFKLLIGYRLCSPDHLRGGIGRYSAPY